MAARGLRTNTARGRQKPETNDGRGPSFCGADPADAQQIPARAGSVLEGSRTSRFTELDNVPPVSERTAMPCHHVIVSLHILTARTTAAGRGEFSWGGG